MAAVITMNRDMNAYQFYALCLMVFVFLVVIAVVALLTIKWPGNLYNKVEEAQRSAKHAEESAELVRESARHAELSAERVEELLDQPAFRDFVELIVNKTMRQSPESPSASKSSESQIPEQKRTSP